MEQQAFIKFPTSSLKSTDTITGAAIRIYKTGGGEGPVTVTLSSCEFKSESLTFTSSAKLTKKGQVVSDGSSNLPSESNMHVSVKLASAKIQAARSSGDHICLRVSGGPKDAPAVFASSRTSNKPELVLQVQSAPATASQKAKKATEKKTEKKELKKEADLEGKFKAVRHKEFLAAALSKKAEKAKLDMNAAKAKALKEKNALTSGAQMKVIKGEVEKQENTKMADAVKTQTAAIKAEEGAKKNKELLNSGLKGTQRSNLDKKLTTAMSVTIADRIKKMRAEQKAKTAKAVVAAVDKKVAAKKAQIERNLATTIAKLTKTASSLTSEEKNDVDKKVSGAVAEDVAKAKADKLNGVVQKPAAAKAKAATKDSEKKAADANKKVAAQVEKELPKKLADEVSRALKKEMPKTIEALKKKLTAESKSKTQQAIEKATQGKKTEKEKQSITADISAKAKAQLKKDLAQSTTGSGLNQLTSQMKTKLEKQLKPALVLKLKATAEAEHKPKAEAKKPAAAKKAAAQPAAKPKAVTKKKPAGNPPAELDLADSYHPSVVELDDEFY
jgi:histone H1/5